MDKIFFLFLLVVFVGCAGTKTSKPNNCLKRTAVIEFGTNRVKSKIFDFDSCKTIVKKEIESNSEPLEFSQSFSDEFDQSISIDPKIFYQALSYLDKLKLRFSQNSVQDVNIFATGVFRRASNLESFFDKVEKLFLTKVNVISSIDEAQLALEAVNPDLNTFVPYCVWDIGGDSMLFACRKSKDKSIFALGLPGSQRVFKATHSFTKKSKEKEIKRYFQDVFEQSNMKMILSFIIENPEIPIFGIGGVHERAIYETLQKLSNSADRVYTIEDVTDLRANLKGTKSESFSGPYSKNQSINIDYVLAVMEYLNLKKIQVSSAKPLDAFYKLK